MPRKTTILIIILIIVTGALVYMALKTEQTRAPAPSPIPKQIRKPTPKVVPKTATVFFSPSSVSLGTSSASFISADVMVNTGESQITGVQIELSFDPKIITNVSIQPPLEQTSFFGPQDKYLVLFRNVDMTNGRASYAIAVRPREQAAAGVGKIATLTFQVQKPSQPLTQTQITFVPKTMVTIEGARDSALKETIPLTVNFTSSLGY